MTSPLDDLKAALDEHELEETVTEADLAALIAVAEADVAMNAAEADNEAAQMMEDRHMMQQSAEAYETAHAVRDDALATLVKETDDA